jgi:Tol biopolymer transport system component
MSASGNVRAQFLAVLGFLVATTAGAAAAPVSEHSPSRTERPTLTLPASAQIAFIGERSGVRDVYTMTTHGGRVAALTSFRPQAGAVDISADGRYAFINASGDTFKIWTADANGSNPRQLASGENPAWSPDGTQIAFGYINFNNVDDPRDGVYVVNADGSGYRELVITKGNVDAPTVAWSPDGGMLAYATDDELDLLTIATGKKRKLATLGDSAQLAWSPDGTEIAFNDNNNVFVVPASGGKPRQLTHSSPSEEEDGVSWRADGTVTFLDLLNNDYVATAINPDGTGSRKLFTIRYHGVDWPPKIVWTHGGAEAVISGSLTSGPVLRLNGDGTHRREVLAGDSASTPAWSANGSRLAFATETGVRLLGPGARTRKLPARCEQLSWSPNGQKIICGIDNIYQLDLKGRFRDRPLLEDQGIGDPTKADPDFAPDGKRFVYVERDLNALALYDFAHPDRHRGPADQHVQLSHAPPGVPDAPAWSPDGKRIAFGSDCSSSSPCTPGIFVVDLNGNHLRRISKDGLNPDWSPDGLQIVFDSVRNGNRDIYMINAGGGRRRRLTHDPAVELDPSWRPSR